MIEKIESALSKKDSGKSLKQNLLPILKNFIDDNNANIKELFMKEKNGLRIENQQWGADHGFAVLNLGIDRVEVIKGPSSLIYGADALGGVIYLADEPYANLNKQEIIY